MLRPRPTLFSLQLTTLFFSVMADPIHVNYKSSNQSPHGATPKTKLPIELPLEIFHLVVRYAISDVHVDCLCILPSGKSVYQHIAIALARVHTSAWCEIARATEHYRRAYLSQFSPARERFYEFVEAMRANQDVLNEDEAAARDEQERVLFYSKDELGRVCEALRRTLIELRRIGP